MTIRQLLTRKATALTLLVWALSIAGLAIVIVFDEHLGPLTILTMAAAMIVTPVASLYIFFRCPACKVCLGSLVGRFGPMNWLAKKVDYCPYCGVQLDSPVAP